MPKTSTKSNRPKTQRRSQTANKPVGNPKTKRPGTSRPRKLELIHDAKRLWREIAKKGDNFKTQYTCYGPITATEFRDCMEEFGDTAHRYHDVFPGIDIIRGECERPSGGKALTQLAVDRNTGMCVTLGVSFTR